MSARHLAVIKEAPAPETFRTSRLLDFASQRELTAQIGHPPSLWPMVAVKELVDNALDATEQIEAPPELTVTVTPTSIEVADNGPGLSGDVLDDVLDFTVRVSSREAYVGPTRGAQGNALKTLLVMPFVLDGNAGLVEIESLGIHHRIELAIDRIAQEPKAEVRRGPSLVKSGTVVRLHWPDSASSMLADAVGPIRDQLYKFAVFNPHLSLKARVGTKDMAWEPTDPSWRRWRPSDPAPAQWYDVPRLERLIAAMIHADRRAGRVRTVRELVARFRGLSGTGKQKAILAELGLARASLEDLVGVDGALDRDTLERLLAAMRAASKAPKPEALGIIGKDHLLARLDLGEVGRESFTYRRTVDDNTLSPRIAETAFAFDEERLRGRHLLCGLNNSPALSDAGAFRELGVDGLGGLLSRQYATADAPITFVMHLTGARLSFTDRGKSAVSL
jgi:DNA topoisomerase VI subunit B